MKPTSYEELAQQAYRTYAGFTDFKNDQGLPMPEWDALPVNIRAAWKAAVQLVWLRAGQENLVYTA